MYDNIDIYYRIFLKKFSLLYVLMDICMLCIYVHLGRYERTCECMHAEDRG